MEFKKLLAPALMVSTLALTGCNTSGVAKLLNALNQNFLEGTTTQEDAIVEIVPTINPDTGELINLQVTAFGVTANFSAENIANADPHVIEKLVGINNIVIISPFDTWQDIFNLGAAPLNASMEDEWDEEETEKLFFAHASAFVVKYENSEGEMEPAILTVGMEENPDIVQIAAGSFGQITQVNNVGNVGFVDEESGSVHAYYQGYVSIIDSPKDNPENTYTIDGHILLEADFTEGTIGGYIGDLTATHGYPGEVEGGYVGTSIESQILVKETNIDGNHFETELAVIENQPENQAPGLGEGPEGTEVIGFFNSSSLEGTFFGENGEEVGGAITYDRALEFDGEALGEIPEPGVPQEAFGLGVFSAKAEVNEQ